MLNLDQARWPRWNVSAEAPLCLSPSVDTEANGHRCHYVIHYGHVAWVPSGGYLRRVLYDHPGRSR